jgi:hypothetical protein
MIMPVKLVPNIDLFSKALNGICMESSLETRLFDRNRDFVTISSDRCLVDIRVSTLPDQLTVRDLFPRE